MLGIDLTGLPETERGNKYVLVWYKWDSNSIKSELLKSKSDAEQTRGLKNYTIPNRTRMRIIKGHGNIFKPKPGNIRQID